MLLDWGVKQTKGDKNTQCLRRIIDLIYIYQPDAIIFENVNAAISRRCPRVRKLLSAVQSFAFVRDIEVYTVSRLQVRTAFLPFGGFTKHQIASIISGNCICTHVFYDQGAEDFPPSG